MTFHSKLDDYLGIHGKAREFLEAVDESIIDNAPGPPPKLPGSGVTKEIIKGLICRYKHAVSDPKAWALIAKGTRAHKLKQDKLAKAAEREAKVLATLRQHLSRGIDYAVDQCVKAKLLGRTRAYAIAKKHNLTGK